MALTAPTLAVPKLRDDTPEASPPCFYWEICRRRAELEKGGKSVCRRCAQRIRGVPYPLRSPSRAPLYLTGRAAAEAMDMVETHRKRPSRTRRRGGSP